MNKKYVMLLVCLTFLLTGCQNTKTKKETTIIAMDTAMTMTIYGTDETVKKAKEFIQDLEQKLDVTSPKSEIYHINDTKTGIISNETSNIIKQSLDLCKRTNGNLDISIYPVLKEWGFTTGKYKIPKKNILDTKMCYVNYNNISCNTETNTVTIEENMEIDLGAVAKGYTGDCLINLLKEEGVTSALLNLGGNIQALGHKPDNTMWKIGIQNPFDKNQYMGIIQIADKAVVTSGSYERYFTMNGVMYCHIIDPITAMPVQNGLVSVTIVGENGLVCDGLSTALFVMGLDKAIQFWQESNDFEALFVTDDGTVTITEGLINDFTLTKDITNINQEMEIIYRD